MAENVNIITWPNVNVEPLDDALVYETAIGGGGVIYGCTATLANSNTLHVNAGHAIICGRKLTIAEDDIPVTLATSGTLKGRLYLQLDLSNTTAPAQMLVETGSSLTPPVQDENVNIINGTYEIDLYHFTVSPVEISGLTKMFTQITGGGADLISDAETNPASFLHQKGDYLIYDNTLYKVIQPINAGNALVVDGNIEATTVAEEISSINTDLATESFTMSKVSGSQTSFVANGFYDRSSKTVRVYVSSFSSGGATTSTEVAIGMPAKYRPSSNKLAIGYVDGYAASMVITTDGKLVQQHSSAYTNVFAVVEYVLG